MKFLVKRLIDLFLGNQWLDRYLRHRYANELFPRGHFYSPLPDRAAADHLLRTDLEIAGIDLNLPAQSACNWLVSRGLPLASTADCRVSLSPGQSGIRSRRCLCALRCLSPRRMIEVGSSFELRAHARYPRPVSRRQHAFYIHRPVP